MALILKTVRPFALAVPIKGISLISITEVRVTLASVAMAGRDNVSAGITRKLMSPVPDGGKSLSLRLRKSIMRRPLQNTGTLNPVMETADIILSIGVSFYMRQ